MPMNKINKAVFPRRFSASVCQACRLVYRVELADVCLSDVRRARCEFVEKLRDGAWQDRTVTASYPVSITTETFTRDQRSVATLQQRRRFMFLVTNYCCGAQVELAVALLCLCPSCEWG